MTKFMQLTRALRELKVRMEGLFKPKSSDGKMHLFSVDEIAAAHQKYMGRPQFAWAFDELSTLVEDYDDVLEPLTEEENTYLKDEVKEFLDDIKPFWAEMLQDDPELGFYKGKLEKLVEQI